MITVTLFNIMVVLISYLSKWYRSDLFLKIAFFLIFLFIGLRFDYGNDYMAYVDSFYKINEYSSIDYLNGEYQWEVGWILLCRIFGPLGFFIMIAFLAAFNCIVYFRFIKKYVPYQYWWLGVFLYVFSPYIMLLHLTIMRQSIAIAIFVYSLDFLCKRNAVGYFVCIAIAVLFHSSALILFFVYFFIGIDWDIKRKASVVIFLVFLVMIVFNNFFMSYINQYAIINLPKYFVYLDRVGDVDTGLGVVYNSIVFAIILFYLPLQSPEKLILFKVGVIGYFIIPFGMLILMISRIGIYFQPSLIAIIPIILSSADGRSAKKMIFLSYVLFVLYTYYGFFQSEIYGEPYANYKTIFLSL